MFFSLLFSCVVFFVKTGRVVLFILYRIVKRPIADSPMFEEYGHAQTMGPMRIPLWIKVTRQRSTFPITLTHPRNRTSLPRKTRRNPPKVLPMKIGISKRGGSMTIRGCNLTERKNMMTCSLCIKHKKKNAMTSGTNNFRTSTLTRHADHTDHKAALLGGNFEGQA